MVMSARRRKTRRLGVAEAKARFAQVLRDTASGPTIIQSRGRDVAVVLSLAEYAQLSATAEREPVGQQLVDELSRWRRRAGDVSFTPERARIVPHEFGRQ